MLLSLLFSEPQLFFVIFLAVVYGITVHEFSHVLAAYLLGDDTGKQLGRLTLNPAAHLEPFGLLMILMIGLGWGRPAPFNPYNLKYKRWGPALVAMAGPLANILSILLFIVVYKIWIFSGLVMGDLVYLFIQYLLWINLALIVFNLLPIPPLDGSRVLLTILPNSLDNFKFWLIKNGPYLLLGLVVFDNFILNGLLFNFLLFKASSIVNIFL